MSVLQPPEPNPQLPRYMDAPDREAAKAQDFVVNYGGARLSRIVSTAEGGIEHPKVCRRCGTSMDVYPGAHRVCDSCWRAEDDIDDLAYLLAEPPGRDDVLSWFELVEQPLDMADHIDLAQAPDLALPGEDPAEVLPSSAQEPGSVAILCTRNGEEPTDEDRAKVEGFRQFLEMQGGSATISAELPFEPGPAPDDWETPQEVLDAQPGRVHSLAADDPVGEASEATGGPTVGSSDPAEAGAAQDEPPSAQEAPDPTPPGWCPHGMPSSASCITCMEEGPVVLTPLKASRWQQARYETQCERAICVNKIQPGEMIGFVTDVGWCCKSCTVRHG